MIRILEADHMADGVVLSSKAVEVRLDAVPQRIFGHETLCIFVDAIFFFVGVPVPRAAPHLLVHLG